MIFFREQNPDQTRSENSFLYLSRLLAKPTPTSVSGSTTYIQSLWAYLHIKLFALRNVLIQLRKDTRNQIHVTRGRRCDFIARSVLPLYIMQRTSRVIGGRAVEVNALRYKPAGLGFDSRWCHWNFSVT